MPTKSKGKRKGKKRGKKGKKKTKVIPDPLPLHVLTEIYKNIDSLAKQLLDARIIARKKRKEAELVDNELQSLKRDDVVYREHLQGLLDEVMENLLDFQARINKERESIEKEVIKVNADLQKRLEKTLQLIEEGEKRIEELTKSLKEMQPLKDMVAKTMEKLQLLIEEYNRLCIEVTIKTTHLRNQYLNYRADLYNYLYEQLLFLISKVRSYLMPILWEHMQKLQMRNRCHRWDLIQIDELNFKLLEQRNQLLKKVETLDGEEQYYGTDWVFERLNSVKVKYKEEQQRWKQRLREVFKYRNLTQHYKKKQVVAVEKIPPRVVTDFREFLRKRLEAISEAKERQETVDRRREIQKKNMLFSKQQSTARQRRAEYTEFRTGGGRRAVATAHHVQPEYVESQSRASSVTLSKMSTVSFTVSESFEHLEDAFDEHEDEEEGDLQHTRSSVHVRRSIRNKLSVASKMSVRSVGSRHQLKERTSIADVEGAPNQQKKLSKVPSHPTIDEGEENDDEDDEE